MVCLATLAGMRLAGAADRDASTEETKRWAGVERLGPPTMYSPSVDRYRFPAPDVARKSYYAIPTNSVNRATYMAWMERSGMLEYARQPRRGLGGPRQLLPSLAKWIETKDPYWGEACIEGLKDFHRAILEEIEQKGWTEQFNYPPAYLPIYRRYLIEGGLMSPDDLWFRELWLDFARNLHVWGTEPVEWRGPCHRSMPEALTKALAAKWYPDIPEAEHWRNYSLKVWNDFWRFKELMQNDTGYFQDATRAYAFSSSEWFEDDRFISDLGILPVWERLMAEITPDGAINPYGPNGGWNSTAALRVGLLEQVAAATSDGRFRFAAHKAMNYLLYQQEPTLSDGYLLEMETAPYIFLAWLHADDSIEPVDPGNAPHLSHRHEVARMPHRDKTIVGRFLPDLDPHPDRANLCCNQTFTERLFPDKLVMRSGWSAGDFFVLVDVVPTSFPFNAGGILGMTRWGAPFTQLVTSKGMSPENRMSVRAVGEPPQLRYLPSPDRINEDWQRGKMPDIRSRAEIIHEDDLCVVARVHVQNPEGLPARYEREFVFVKDGYLVTRELVTFEESFHAEVSALWNTQNIGPQIGSHWANTFMTAPIASNGRVPMRTPPADLLVYFVPQDNWKLQVVDRTYQDARARDCPAQLRYTWNGLVESGMQLHSTQVYYPHAATRARPTTNNPGATAVFDGGKIEETAGASGIAVIKNSPGQTVLQIRLVDGTLDWIRFGTAGDEVSDTPPVAIPRHGFLRQLID